MTTTRVVRIGAAVAMAAVLLAGCGGSSGGSEPVEPTTTKAPVTTTTAATTTTKAVVTTTTAAVTTTKPSGPTTTAATTEPTTANLEPGDPCSIEEGVPDCIDPDDDGEGTYLIGGADCMATAPDPAICTDLDGDGLAGYPDSN